MVLNNAVNAQTQGFQSLNTSTGVWNGRTLTPGTGISITNQDGTGGNPTISATSSPPDTAFGTYTLVEDFGCLDSTQMGDTNWLINNTDIFISGEANHPGIIRLSNSTGGNTVTKNGASTSILRLGSGQVTVEMIVRVSTLGTGNIWIGLADNAVSSVAEPVNGVYFNYASGTNSGKWVGKTSSASSRSSANSNNTVVLNQWDRLKIVVNSAGTSVSFFVNGTEITNSPLSTNIPSAAIGLTFVTQNLNTKVDVDIVTLQYVLAVSR